jgi:cytochrome c
VPIARRDRCGAVGLACLALLVACRDGSTPGANGSLASTPENADQRRGELLSLACQACHTLHSGEPNLIGPNLYGVFGRVAGTRPGFMYSEALRLSGIVWTPETLERWLAAPDAFLPGTTMVFAGYADPEDRRVLLEYLLRVTTYDSSP